MLPLIPIALSLAPALARWLGGNDAGAVTAQVAEVARAVVGSDDAGQVAAALEADPAKRADLQIELARIAAEREAAEHAARIEEMRVAAADRADARQMARGGGPLALGAGLVTAASFLMLAGLVGLLTMADIPGGSRELLVTIAGGVLVLVQSAAAFWVGSSAGSAAKSGLMGGVAGGPFGQGRG
jgi:hypothetical protein